MEGAGRQSKRENHHRGYTPLVVGGADSTG
jgi:hypothetical protein